LQKILSRKRSLATEQGLSLIEMMIILFVVLILVLIAIPTFNTLTQNYRLSTAAETLYNMLQYARSEAIKQNTSIYVNFQTGDNWCYGINAGSACNCTIPSSCSLGSQSAPTTQQLSLSATGLTSNSIWFEPTHAAANAAGSITFTVYGQTIFINTSISRLGNLQICSTGISGYNAC
jgi:Tfp pilus assembly protein FimT